MLAHLLGAVLSLSGVTAYLVVGGLALVESAAFVGLFLPGETALLYGGVLAGRGNVSLPMLVAVAAVAAVVGDSIGYEIGRRAGRPLRGSRAGRWVGAQRWSRAEQLVERHGGPAVFLGRWVGVLRALVPTVAGLGRMPYRRFLAWNVLGGVTWASTLVVLGYAFSGSVSALVAAVASAGLVLTAVTVAGVCLAILARWLPGRAPLLRGALRAAVGSAPADLLVGVALVVGLVAVFALVLDGVLDGGATVALDHQVLVAFSGDREPIVTGYLSALSWLTSPVQVSAATCLIAGALSWRQRSWAVLAVAGLTLAGSGALTYLVKHLVGRPRPSVPYALTPDLEPSFPSGHTLTATAMAGLLAWYVARDASERWVRATAIGCAVGFVVLVAVSRLYLGAHWLSDVVGSVPLGLAWLVTVLLGLALAGRRSGPAGTLSPRR